jgi:ribosomal protein S18 acetylase RimI-like enzyme
MAIEIRDALPEEHEELGELVVAAYRGLGVLEGDEAYEVELRDVDTRARDAVVLAAVDRQTGRLVGCATYVPGSGSSFAEALRDGEASIRMLAVDPSAQGTGAGTALAAACVERARADGFRAVMLHSLPVMARAQRIYARLGFRHVPERDWEPVPGLVLRCFVLEL